MAKRGFHFLSILLMVLGSSACGVSPLFNHADAEKRLPTGIELKPQTDAPDCPQSFPKMGLCASVEWTKWPTSDETGSFHLRFWSSKEGSKDGPYVSPSQTVFVKLWMPSMGHGSSPTRVQPSKQTASGEELPGEFDVTSVFFVMPGAWEIHIQLKAGSSVEDESILSIQI